MLRPFIATVMLSAVMWTSTSVCAQDPMAPQPPELVRSLTHEQLGALLLPFDWTEEVLDDGLRVVSTPSADGSVTSIELALVEFPHKLSLKHYAKAFTSEVQATHKGVRVLLEEPLKHGKIKGKRAEYLLEEGGHLMHYLVLFIPQDKNALVLTLGAPASTYEAQAPEAFLLKIFDAMRPLAP